MNALKDVLNRTKHKLGVERFATSKFQRAAELFVSFSTGEFQEFLPTAAYAEL